MKRNGLAEDVQAITVQYVAKKKWDTVKYTCEKHKKGDVKWNQSH